MHKMQKGVKWRKIMNKYNIAKDYCTCLYNYRVPRGAMYGSDSLGIWICQDYRVYTDPGTQRHYYKVKRVFNADITLYEKVNRRHVTTEKTRYSISVWRSEIVFLDSSTGIGISKILRKYHPKVVPYSQANTRKNNEIQFNTKQPVYKTGRNVIPDRSQPGIKFNKDSSFWKSESLT